MKTKLVCWTILGLALIAVLASPVLAHWTVPGMSPGWWKRQIGCLVENKGKPQISWTDLNTWTGMINAYWGLTPPDFHTIVLPPVSSMDYDGDGSFGVDDAYGIFGDTNWNHMWTPLANWYNWASGRGPVW